MTAAAAVTAQVDFWSCCPRAPQWRPYRFRVENLATLKENVLTERGHRAVPSKVHTAHFFVPWARDLIARGRTHRVRPASRAIDTSICGRGIDDAVRRYND